MSDVFHVTMLDVLRAPFESWLAVNDLALAHVPDTDEDQFIVVPGFTYLPPPDAEQWPEVDG